MINSRKKDGFRLISTNGNGLKYVIRKDLLNNKLYVIEVYNSDQNQPNIISGQFKKFRDAKNAISEYQHSNDIKHLLGI